MNIRKLVYWSILLLLLPMMESCNKKQTAPNWTEAEDDKETKKMLQGIWSNEDENDVAFRIKGDTIFYPDTTSVPVYFTVANDTLRLHGATPLNYPIVKLTPHLFIFKNSGGDQVRLVPNTSAEALTLFERNHVQPLSLNQGKLLKKDSVVTLGKDKYHYYVQVNPTTYKVYKSVMNDDGVVVDNVYYDNIVHLSVYKGGQKLYSHDFHKKDFYARVAPELLNGAILNDLVFDKIAEDGIRFRALLSIPDSPSSLYANVKIDFNGGLHISTD